MCYATTAGRGHDVETKLPGCTFSTRTFLQQGRNAIFDHDSSQPFFFVLVLVPIKRNFIEANRC